MIAKLIIQKTIKVAVSFNILYSPFQSLAHFLQKDKNDNLLEIIFQDSMW